MRTVITKLFFVFILTVSPVFAGDAFYVPDKGLGDQSAEKDYLFVDQSRAAWYYGGSLGGSYSSFNLGGAMNRSADANNAEFNATVDKIKNTFYADLGAFTGYGTYFNNGLYLGGELSATYSSLHESANGTFTDVLALTKTSGTGDPTHDISVSHNMAVTVIQPLTMAFDIMPGYLPPEKDYLFYGRLGVGVNWVKLKLNDSFNDQNINTSANRIKLSYRLGLGVERFINKTFGLRVEYLYYRLGVGDDHNLIDAESRRIGGEASWTNYAATNLYKYLCGIGHVGVHTINVGISIRP